MYVRLLTEKQMDRHPDFEALYLLAKRSIHDATSLKFQVRLAQKKYTLDEKYLRGVLNDKTGIDLLKWNLEQDNMLRFFIDDDIREYPDEEVDRNGLHDRNEFRYREKETRREKTKGNRGSLTGMVKSVSEGKVFGGDPIQNLFAAHDSVKQFATIPNSGDQPFNKVNKDDLFKDSQGTFAAEGDVTGFPTTGGVQKGLPFQGGQPFAK
jgi:hypothetical protein